MEVSAGEFLVKVHFSKTGRAMQEGAPTTPTTLKLVTTPKNKTVLMQEFN